MPVNTVTAFHSQQSLVSATARIESAKEETPKERTRMCVVANLSMLVVFLLIVVITFAVQYKKPGDLTAEKCITEKCIASAYVLLDAMDRTADPCEDFYKFACGNWAKGHPVREGESSRGCFDDQGESITGRLKELLVETSASTEPTIVRQLKYTFAACKDTDTLETLGLDPIMQVLDNVSLPKEIPNSKTAEDWDLTNTLALVHRTLNLDTLLKLGLDGDSGNFMLQLNPALENTILVEAFVRDRDKIARLSRLSSEKKEEVMRMYTVQVLQEMNSWQKKGDEEKLDQTALETAANNIDQFAGNITAGTNASATASTTVIHIPEFQRVVDSSTRSAKFSHKIDWERFVTVLTEGSEKPFNIEKDSVSVININYFQNLAWLITNTDIETIQLYLWWQVVEALAVHSNSAMRNLDINMNNQLYGASTPQSRSMQCLRRIKKLFPIAYSYPMAVSEDISSTVTKVSEMLSDIRTSFKSMVKDSDWLDPVTKKAAQEKADAIVQYIGYQDWILAPGKLDERFGLVIPAGILRFPFYGHGIEALNYGAIGSILGHELTHGFDSNGKDYGNDGSKVSWWKEKTLDAFNKRTQCFIQQYGNFSVDGHQVNGELTLAENIADNGGVREAYRAYQLYKERHGEEPPLPGLEDFTHDQLLFLALANLYCVDEGENYGESATKDEHSPDRCRVRGPLANSPEFSSTWNCPKGTTMNPTNKCIIW